MWARSPTYSDLDPGQLLISSGVGGSNWREHELPRWLRLYETPTCSSSAECFAAGWDAGEPGVALTVRFMLVELRTMPLASVATA